MRNLPRIRLLPVLACSCLSAVAIGQQGPAMGWSGWARCEISVQGNGYSDKQTHTWTVAGGAPTVQGAFHVYQGTWSVVGGGSLSRTTGSQTLKAEWATNVAGLDAPIAVFVRASDNKLLIQARHAQLRQAGAVQGYQQQIVSGTPQKPGALNGEAFEWQFPLIAVSAPVPPSTHATANGSSNLPVSGSVGPMQPGGSQVTAACTWKFGQGSAAPTPPSTLSAQAVPVPGGTSAAVPPPRDTVANAPAELPTIRSPGTPPDQVTVAPPAATTPPATTTPPASSPILTATPLDPAVMPLPRICTLRGPGLSTTTRGSYATPGAAILQWETVPDATGYIVSRSDLGVLTPTPVRRTEQWFRHSAKLPHPGTYTYTVTANYPHGCGSTVFNLSSQAPQTPPLAFQILGTGQVDISWQGGFSDPNWHKVGDFSGVLVTGPTLPPAGKYVQSGSIAGIHLLMTGVPAGSQTWKVKAFWDTPQGRVWDDTGRTITVMVP